MPEAAGVLRRRGTGSAAEVGNWGRTAEEEDGGVAVGRERLEVSGWAGHAEDKIDLFGAIIIL